MSEFEMLVSKAMSKTGLSRNEIMSLIDDKRKKIGGGYLTKQGALFLVVSDLEISLSTQESMIDETIKSSEKVSHETTQSDLEKKYKILSSAKNKGDWFRELIPVPFLLALTSLAFIFKYSENLNSIELLVSLIVFIGSSSFLGYFFIKKPVPLISKQEKTFLRFFKIYQSIQKHQYEPSNTDAKKYKNKINELAYFITGWTRRAPSDFSKLPSSVNNNLKNKIIPLFLNNQTKEIKIFIQSYEKLVNFSYNKEVTIQALSDFNKSIEQFPTKKEPKITERSSSSPKKIIAGLIFVALIFGGIFFVVLNYMQMEQSQSLAYSVIGAIAVVAVLINARRVSR